MNLDKHTFLCVLFLVLCALPLAHADETALFTTIKPDALIILDLSGSMDWNPAGGDDIWSNASCSGPFFSSSGDGHSTRCSRLAIAKRAIFDILDDNDDSAVNSSDESSLSIRIGYMRFHDGNDTSGDYATGNIRLGRKNTSGCSESSSTSNALGIGSSYSYINSRVDCENANGGTPLASSLNEAMLYLKNHQDADADGLCRKKFAILITDGADTYACGGTGGETQSDQYKRRRETVAKAKALADSGYKVFVVGFGSAMPNYLENTLNWAAYYGGTDNPLIANSGNTGAYTIEGNALYPSSVSSCSETSTSGVCPNCFATSNDPGSLPLAGYAFLAASADDLATALKQAFNIIKEANYAFSLASVSSSRVSDENFLYEASFVPLNSDPFWRGHLKKYAINADGSIGNFVWDAGAKLQATAAASRNMVTYKSGALVPFTADYITAADVGVATTAERDAIVGYIRGESDRNPDNWKLGDIFRSNPITIGTPSLYFNDALDSNNAFAAFRANHERTSANGKRVVIAGANDGQFHAFRTLDGAEVWSFIPPNLLPKLKNITHAAHPTGLLHQYFIDGPVTAADVWLGTGTGGTKAEGDWRTLAVFGEGRGGGSTLWSSSSSCSSGFSATYSSTYSNFCGYYTFDFTEPLTPQYKWRIAPTSLNAPYLGEPWSRMVIGRVKYGGNERWVGFIGGGYNAANCAGGGSCDTRGKGFFVIDLRTGSVLWSYTRADNSSMEYSVPAPPAIVDTDNDGYVDTAYIGDLGGNIWRLKFCTSSQMASCSSTSSWSGGLLFNATGSQGEGARPVFNAPTVARDRSGNLWVYWSTGDKTDPTAASTNEKVMGAKDNDRTKVYSLNDFENVTSEQNQCNSTIKGWYINFTGREKALSDIVVFGGVVYFTTYIPSEGGSACDQAGTSKFYAINYETCDGALANGARSISIGVGIASGPVVTIGPDGKTVTLYVTLSGGAGLSGGTIIPPGLSFLPSPSANMLYWKDRRVR